MNRFWRVIRTALWVGVLAWAATIFYFSSLAGAKVEELNMFHLWDKLAHFAAFAAGGLLLAGSFRFTTRWTRGTILRRTILILAFYAASDEYHQLYTPGRSGADLGDWLADTLGVAFGAGLVLVVRFKRPEGMRVEVVKAEGLGRVEV